MKMVILGAGASFDSIYELYDQNFLSAWRPPLANQLFEPRSNFRSIFERYHGVNILYSSLNTVQDIEDFFQKEWSFAESKKATELLASLINVQYALQELMYKISFEYRNIGLSNYDILIRHAYEYSKNTNEDVIFVTFNYDLLLEYSLIKMYPLPNNELSMDDYLRFPIKIIKPHGSCNWFKPLKDGFVSGNKYEHFNDLYRKKPTLEELMSKLEERILVRNNSVGNEGGTKKYYYPHLLIPLKSKDSFVLPEDHLNYLKRSLPLVDSILIIGWKGQEESFLNLLSENLREKTIEMTCVNGSSEGYYEHFLKYLPKLNFSAFNGEFSIKRNNSTMVHFTENTFNSRTISHTKGSFSAYTLSLMNNQFQPFFNIK